MNTRNRIWLNKDIYGSCLILANALLVFACLILIPYLLAPLFGGKFIPRSIALYGNWIIMAFVIKYELKYIRNKIRMKKYKWYAIFIWMTLSTFIWFPNYIGIVMIAIIILGMIAGFKAQGKYGWQNEE